MTEAGSSAVEPPPADHPRGAVARRGARLAATLPAAPEQEAAQRRAVPAAHRAVMWAGIAVIALAFILFLSTLRERAGLDMTVYWRAAQVLHDANPSTDSLYAPSLVEVGGLDLPFTYPPAAALLFWPLGGMSLEQAWSIMEVANGLLLAAFAWLVLRLAPFSRSWFLIRPMPTLVAFAVTCGLCWHLYPTWFTYTFGQINLLLAVLILADFGRRRAGRRGTGFLTGMAAGIKITPAAMGLVPLAQGRWRTIAGMAAGLAFTVIVAAILLPREVVDFFTVQLWSTGRVGDEGRIANQSLNGVLHLWGVPESLLSPLWLVLVVLTIALGAVGIRRVSRAGDQFAATVIGAMIMLLISPISWEHHWVWVLPLVLALLPAHPRRTAAWQWAISIALIVLLFVVFSENPSVRAAAYLGDTGATVVFNGSPTLDRLGTVPVLASILATAWVALRPRALAPEAIDPELSAREPIGPARDQVREGAVEATAPERRA